MPLILQVEVFTLKFVRLFTFFKVFPKTIIKILRLKKVHPRNDQIPILHTIFFFATICLYESESCSNIYQQFKEYNFVHIDKSIRSFVKKYTSYIVKDFRSKDTQQKKNFILCTEQILNFRPYFSIKNERKTFSRIDSIFNQLKGQILLLEKF